MALAESIGNHHESYTLHVLIVDGTKPNIVHQNIIWYDLTEITDSTSIKIKNKYHGNKLRWACKPLFLSYLLEKKIASQLIYFDNDICVVGNTAFLFEMLGTYPILLTPHHYNQSPNYSQNWFEANFRVGLYNAGFIGANTDGLSALKWWAECCLYNIKKSYSRGLFDDQKYLDLLPVIFDGVQIVKHGGCNIAGWNIDTLKRTNSDKDKLLINSIYEPIFIHFTPLTIENILNKSDHKLTIFWNKYHNLLKFFNQNYSYKKELKKNIFDYYNYFFYTLWKIKRHFE